MNQRMSDRDRDTAASLATDLKGVVFDSLGTRARIGIATHGRLGLHTFVSDKAAKYCMYGYGQLGAGIVITMDKTGRYNLTAFRREGFLGARLQAQQVGIPNSDIGRTLSDFVASLPA